MTQPTNGNTPVPAQQPWAQPATGTTFPARAADESVPWARQTGSKERATSRNRQRVHDLPGWDPLPPGEILVQRHRWG